MSGKLVDVKQHAQLGASNAHRWMVCHGSVALTRGLPNNDNDYSREGTAAHELGQRALEKNADTNMWLGMEFVVGSPPKAVAVDEEMVEHVQTYVDFVREQMRLSPTMMWWIERKFDLRPVLPAALASVDMFGTSDVVLYDPTTYTLYVDDLKYGKGVVVEAVDNEQLRYYALGAVLSIQQEFPSLRVDQIVMTIIQPRASHIDGPIRSETIDIVSLLEFTGVLLDAAAETLKPNAKLVAGDHCKFCLAAGRCPEQLRMAQEIARVEFSEMLPNVPEHMPPSPELLPSADLGEMVQKLDLLSDWIKAMWGEVERRLTSGEKVPGVKLVAKRAYRKWVDEARARDVLTGQLGLEDAEIEDRSLKSPPQLEKLLGKRNFRMIEDELVHKVSSGNTVALASDARPEVLALPGSEFGDTPSPNEKVDINYEI